MTALLKTIGNLPLVTGIARTLDLLGAWNRPNPYRHAQNPMKADAEAIARDWQVVGADLEHAAAELQAEAEAEAR